MVTCRSVFIIDSTIRSADQLRCRPAQRAQRIHQREMVIVVCRYFVQSRLLQREPCIRYIELRSETLAVAQLGQLIDALSLTHRRAGSVHLQTRTLELAQCTIILETHALLELSCL